MTLRTNVFIIFFLGFAPLDTNTDAVQPWVTLSAANTSACSFVFPATFHTFCRDLKITMRVNQTEQVAVQLYVPESWVSSGWLESTCCFSGGLTGLTHHVWRVPLSPVELFKAVKFGATYMTLYVLTCSSLSCLYPLGCLGCSFLCFLGH